MARNIVKSGSWLYMCARSPVMSVDSKLLKVRSCTYVMETFVFGCVEYRGRSRSSQNSRCVHIISVNYCQKKVLLL